jgi:hypothetical protein
MAKVDLWGKGLWAGSVYGVNEPKKGQFEPARVRKLNEKQFS